MHTHTHTYHIGRCGFDCAACTVYTCISIRVYTYIYIYIYIYIYMYIFRKREIYIHIYTYVPFPWCRLPRGSLCRRRHTTRSTWCSASTGWCSTRWLPWATWRPSTSSRTGTRLMCVFYKRKWAPSSTDGARARLSNSGSAHGSWSIWDVWSSPVARVRGHPLTCARTLMQRLRLLLIYIYIERYGDGLATNLSALLVFCRLPFCDCDCDWFVMHWMYIIN